MPTRRGYYSVMDLTKNRLKKTKHTFIFLYCNVSTLNPMVGIVCTASSDFWWGSCWPWRPRRPTPEILREFAIERGVPSVPLFQWNPTLEPGAGAKGHGSPVSSLGSALNLVVAPAIWLNIYLEVKERRPSLQRQPMLGSIT